MTPEELAFLIEDLILGADKRFAASISRVQKDLHAQLVSVLKDLELDSDGYIKQTAQNRRVLTIADRKINEVFGEPNYVGAVTSYVAVVPKLDAANIKYFKGIDELFEPNKQYLKSLQKETISTVEKYVLQDGLQSQIIQPLSQILNQNVNSGGRFDGFLEQIRTYVVGNPDVEGRALSYSRTFLKNAMFQYSRTFQESITSGLGLDWYLYSGGLMDTSREFCIERAGKYYHRKEIEAWADLDWHGKIPGTTASSIFVFVAGYGCLHSLIAVSDFIVPEEDKKRII
jgi:hypothetical protein